MKCCLTDYCWIIIHGSFCVINCWNFACLIFVSCMSDCLFLHSHFFVCDSVMTSFLGLMFSAVFSG